MVSCFSGLSRAALFLVLPSQNARYFQIVTSFLGLTLHTASVRLFSGFTRYLNVLTNFITRQSGRTRAVQCGRTDGHEQDNSRNSLWNAPKNLQDSRKRSTVTQWRIQEFCSGGGFNKLSWGQRERGSGGGSSLVRGYGGSCNLVQEISFHIVKFS